MKHAHVRITGPCGSFAIMAPGASISDEATDENSVFVQTDLDYPGVAQRMGWAPCCGWTDGTVDCPEHGRTSSDMIGEARRWIGSREGRGYADLADYFPGAANFRA